MPPLKIDSSKPFVYGRAVGGEAFTDRKAETKRLLNNFEQGINTILISPRRLGKTSLVRKVIGLARSDHLKIAEFDAFGCHSESDFASAFATAVIKATSTKVDEWVANAKQLLAHLVPKIQIGTEPGQEFSVSLDIAPSSMTLDEVLQLPETIAKQKKIQVVVCIDEFQQIGEWPDSLTFQKKLRGVWQLQTDVTYCLYGSKKTFLEKIFLQKNYPFFQFGDIIHLGRISEADWVEYICRRFTETGKTISTDQAAKIAQWTGCYSSYVQQLASLVWSETEKTVSDESIKSAMAELLLVQTPLFEALVEKLTKYQANFLRAVCDGVTTGLTEKSVMEKYDLGASANVIRVRKSLLEKDLIDRTAVHEVDIADPIMKVWLKTYLQN